MRTANPTLSNKTFEQFRGFSIEQSNTMTLQGTVFKSMILLAFCVGTAIISWGQMLSNPQLAIPLAIGGGIGGLIFALITSFKMQWASVTGPLYAICEGVFLGAISCTFEMRFPGIVINAVMLTFGTFGCLLAAYTSGLIKPSENFKLGIAAATGGIFMLYMANIVLGFFGISIPFIHGTGLIGIGFSAFVVVIAALNLVLDFDFIEEGVENGAPKYMEWYASFALMVTLVWLYLEILRLLAKLQSRDD